MLLLQANSQSYPLWSYPLFLWWTTAHESPSIPWIQANRIRIGCIHDEGSVREIRGYLRIGSSKTRSLLLYMGGRRTIKSIIGIICKQNWSTPTWFLFSSAQDYSIRWLSRTLSDCWLDKIVVSGPLDKIVVLGVLSALFEAGEEWIEGWLEFARPIWSTDSYRKGSKKERPLAKREIVIRSFTHQRGNSVIEHQRANSHS